MNRNGHISESTARPNSRTPNRSNESALRERVRVFGSTQTASAIAMMPSGTFIQKIRRQPSAAPPTRISSPPIVGPNAVAMPIVAPKSPNARPRSLPWNSCWMSPSTCGIWMPAATPCSSRAIISMSGLTATAQTRLVTVNSDRPTMNSARRER